MPATYLFALRDLRVQGVSYYSTKALEHARTEATIRFFQLVAYSELSNQTPNSSVLLVHYEHAVQEQVMREVLTAAFPTFPFDREVVHSCIDEHVPQGDIVNSSTHPYNPYKTAQTLRHTINFTSWTALLRELMPTDEPIRSILEDVWFSNLMD